MSQPSCLHPKLSHNCELVLVRYGLSIVLLWNVDVVVIVDEVLILNDLRLLSRRSS